MSPARTLATLTLLVLLAGCTGDGAGATPDPFAGLSVDPDTVRPLPTAGRVPPGRPGEAGGIVLEPVSPHIEHGVSYFLALGHCGLLSPIDVDGSFWDPVDGVRAGGGPLDLGNDVEMINGTPGTLVVIGDEARFRTESGSVLRLSRHEGTKEFSACD